jgi:hypothetical protein
MDHTLIELDKLVIKSSWNEVSIADFFILDAINKDRHLTLTEKNLKILSVISGKGENEFRHLRTEDIKTFLDKKAAFLKEEIAGDLKDYYSIAGRTYKLTRNLDNLAAGQFIDLMNYTKDPELIMDNLHLALTVFLIPCIDLKHKEALFNSLHKKLTRFKRGQRIAQKWRLKAFVEKPENYLQTPASETSEIFFNHLSIADATTISVFFYQLGTLFALSTRDYLLGKLQNQLTSVSKTLNNQQKTPEIQKLVQQITSLQDGPGSSV